ncbi:MAG: hypothetical protein WD716_11815 [Fimbriimonadaceae bacterium]
MLTLGLAFSLIAAPQQPTQQLPPPILLKKKEVEEGNPLAQYCELVAQKDAYAVSPFAPIYGEVMANLEEFLGVASAGPMAASLLNVRAPSGPQPIPSGFFPKDAVAAVILKARETRLVIYGEEHHLPQTRSIYDALLRGLWKEGYRYLAAEAFADEVSDEGFKSPGYKSGFYLRDPIYASAVRTALKLGYRLVPYDTSEQGPRDDASFRDRKQAMNIKERVFDKDPKAKVLVIAGRGHASEVSASDGWTPMASVLKRETGIDPLTIFAPTMTERTTRDQEHPWYRDAVARGLVKHPTVFVGIDGKLLRSESFDAYIFFPPVEVMNGRPDWMVRDLGRSRTVIPSALLVGNGVRLVQAFFKGDPVTSIAADQVLLGKEAGVTNPPDLMLPAGEFRLRTIDATGAELATDIVTVPATVTS